ncbi:MAG: glycosyltransferase [Microthrixaceae bacterium]
MSPSPICSPQNSRREAFVPGRSTTRSSGLPCGPRRNDRQSATGCALAIGFARDERVVAHPVRAIERKNIPGAISLAEALDATYWLLGPAEEGYDEELAEQLRSARCRVVHRGWGDKEGFYLAADHIAFPSTWEGFGNPPIEASLHRRTVSVGDYPVAAELLSHGFRWFRPDQVDSIRGSIDHPGSAALRERLDHDEALALRDFSVETMTARLVALLDEAGWMP